MHTVADRTVFIADTFVTGRLGFTFTPADLARGTYVFGVLAEALALRGIADRTVDAVDAVVIIFAAASKGFIRVAQVFVNLAATDANRVVLTAIGLVNADQAFTTVGLLDCDA